MRTLPKPQKTFLLVSETLDLLTAIKAQEKAKISEAFGWADVTTTPLAAIQLPRDISDVQSGPFVEPTSYVNTTPVEMDETPFGRSSKRKKDKKRGKNISLASWEDSTPSSEPQAKRALEGKITREIDDDSTRETLEKPQLAQSDDFIAIPKSKKDKRKLRKRKSLDWTMMSTPPCWSRR